MTTSSDQGGSASDYRREGLPHKIDGLPEKSGSRADMVWCGKQNRLLEYPWFMRAGMCIISTLVTVGVLCVAAFAWSFGIEALVKLFVILIAGLISGYLISLCLAQNVGSKTSSDGEPSLLILGGGIVDKEEDDDVVLV